jgi:general secretion pathway protein D
MKEGNLETAESLISRAEAIPMSYGLFHVGDTPKKCRQDLEARLKSSKGPKLPSQSAKPAADATAQQGLTPDPFKARTTPPPVGVGETTEPAMPQDAKLAGGSPFGRAINTAPPTADDAALPSAAVESSSASSDSRQKCDQLLLASRKALAVGDVRVAEQQVAAAKAMGVEFGYHDDNPARVEATILKHKDLMSQNQQRESEGWRRSYADLLIDQANQLLRWQDFDEAERLANDALKLRVNYGPFEAKPTSLLDRIAEERKAAGNGIAARPAVGPVVAAAGPGVKPATATAPAAAGSKQECLQILREARAALAAADLDAADQLAQKAESLRVPEREFAQADDRPWLVALEVQKARTQMQGVRRAGDNRPAQAGYPATTAQYDPAQDTSKNRPATAEELPTPGPSLGPGSIDRFPTATPAQATGASQAFELIKQGEQALRDRDTQQALEYFREAYQLRDELDPLSAQRLQDHLQMLAAPANRNPSPAKAPELLDEATVKNQLEVKKLSAEVTRYQMAAREILERDAKQAVQLLTEARDMIDNSAVDPDAQSLLRKRLDVTQAEVDKYLTANRAQLELDDSNKQIMAEVEGRRLRKVEVDERLAKLVNEFNTLMDEQRFAEAEIIAKRAAEIDPENALVVQLTWMSKFARATYNNRNTVTNQDDGAMAQWNSMDEAATPFDDREPYRFPDATKWREYTLSRSQRFAESRSRRTDRELQIERKLKTPVSANFRDRPLAEVLDQLGKLADVNIHLDPKGLTEEGISSDSPVTIDLREAISLKSALNLILEPLHLSYVIKDEVLKITSEQMRDGEVYTTTYSVADLVIPIPNFVPNSRMGLAGALADSLGNAGMGTQGPLSSNAVVASNDGSNASGVINPAVLAQMQGTGGRPATGMPAMQGGGIGGPGGMGGGVQADFDSLIELITNTVSPTTWDEVGGPGTISPFETNLSLVVSQTQEVHDQIRDLLEQLRKLQDLQVTIEVRFITLNDSFFERIGVDFDFNINDNVTTDITADNVKPSAVVGLLPNGDFTADQDVQFRQSSFNLATPQFGTPVDVAQFGFAILSDIEAFFLITAAQGDRRSNVLQAPKVTLFNGQQAFVSDTSQTPFVISVIPVVGDFAAAQQPVIVVLNEGTFLTVQAVVSNDRRFVRLTVVPFFSKIGDVKEFQFVGSTTTTKNTSSARDGEDIEEESDEETTSNEGVTVQLPTFSFVTVTTTVSVPDGGTVLLGGIKRLSEGRNEFGVPILSKLPYVSRLFKNVGIGRETQSLMMMVTPRIIIQEEEEERLGIQSQNP